MGQYHELCKLTPTGIRQTPLALAAAYLAQAHQQEAEPSDSTDKTLIAAARHAETPLPLLCLRCRISHALETWLRVTHRKHGQRHGLDLMAMAGYALDDAGRLTIRTGSSSEAPFVYAELASLPKDLISPFSAEILRTYDPALCGLPNWAKVKIQSHNGLKAYFKEHGLLLISDWALLRHSSTKRVREACERHLRSSASVDTCMALHARYQPRYDEALRDYKTRTGKASGWQPTVAFAEGLDSERNPFDTIELLKKIATAIRQYLTGSTVQRLDQMAEGGHELADTSTLHEPDGDGADPSVLKGLIDTALQRAMDQFMTNEMQLERQKFDRDHARRTTFELYAKGMSQRDMEPYVDHRQAWISRLIDEKRRSTAIATAAALELKRHSAFASCGSSVEAAERLVNALRNHLLEPEREGTIAPLRQWVQTHLSHS